MNTTLATAESFLAAIVAEPGDDGLRLIFADWLEEQAESAEAELRGVRDWLDAHPSCAGCTGPEWQRGKPCAECDQREERRQRQRELAARAASRERAEFIRVQCELARIGHLHPPADDEDRAIIAHANELRRRERELLETHWKEWADGLHIGYCLNLYDGTPLYDPGNIASTFRRGFVAEITLPVSAWIGEECCVCDGRGKHLFPYGNLSDPCGTGRVNAHGPTLVQAAPLQRVTFSDWHPQRLPVVNGSDVWVFNRDPVSEIVRVPEFRDAVYHAHKSEQVALDAASDAALQWALQWVRQQPEVAP